MEPKRQMSEGKEAWILQTDDIELSVTVAGGMIAPVEFFRRSRQPVQPYYISPWQREGLSFDHDPVLNTLRGDFFCMPFGADNDLPGESHHTHGEPVYSQWQLRSYEKTSAKTYFSASLDTRERPGHITKRIMLDNAHSALYVEHELSGYSGSMTLGHHATLRADHLKPGEMKLSTSPIAFGIGRPDSEGYCGGAEYMSVKGSQPFSSLDDVPSIWKEPGSIDAGVFPSRKGYGDIIGVASKGALTDKEQPPVAWTAAVMAHQGYLWYSLKDPKLLPLLVIWTDYYGRHGEPWNGRNLCIGLEDVCGYLAEGLAPSMRENPISQAGVPTVHALTPEKNLKIPYIQGVIPVDAHFDRVRTIDFQEGTIICTDMNGVSVQAPVQWDMVLKGMEWHE